MPDTSRLDELRRRVQQDPASIAFAALADEYRRAGLFEQAIETCRAGLVRHPAYLSARVTLGRALMEIGEYDEAQQHLEQVVRAAPDNLAAIRALAEIHKRRGEASESYTSSAAVPHSQTTSGPAARVVSMPPRAHSSPQNSPPPEPPALEPAFAPPVPLEPRIAVSSPPEVPEPSRGSPVLARPPEPPPAPATDPVYERLEQFLAGIARLKASRAAGASLTGR
jgi:tetratricopeptide (TPR) repeat protein